ncbi:RHS repeat domain-containing protein [Dactylosporangium sp. CS-047395]|uniref:RHS repeat domain-containing protein n=1 Tax=Dactylosporangium sp. CS-047395 TaxID=3239936 RepID=UPI003D8AB392
MRYLVLSTVVLVTIAAAPAVAGASPNAPFTRSAPPLPTQPAAAKGGAVGIKAGRSAGSGTATVAAPGWPAASSTDVAVAAGHTASVQVGGLPVRAVAVAPVTKADGQSRADAAGSSAPSRIRLQTFDRAAAQRAGAGGPMFAVSRSDGGNGAGAVSLEVGYAGFAGAYGGDYGARLRLVRLPGCALSTPQLPQCRTATPVPTFNDTAARTLTATVPTGATTGQVSADFAAGGAMVLAAEAGDTSSQGDYQATKLSPSAKWDVSLASGAFAWTYPIRTPQTPGGLAPQVSLAYTSQSVDGRTANTNNQGSWIGEGFSYEPGYIERRYKSCSDDGHTGYGDQCWGPANASIMLSGSAGDLVKVNDNTWKLPTDDGTKVERLLGATNGDDNGEYWKVTSPDGTQYFFGLNRLPGWSANKDETNSAWVTPVSGDDSGEPCYNADWKSAFCDQGWRWNLDYVKDTKNNVIAYYYGKERNFYARAGKTDVNGAGYDRGGWLKRVDYGQVDGQVYTTDAPARVVFDTGERCLPTGGITCAEAQLTDDNAYAWPDVPWDRNCAANTHCKATQAGPTFWTRKRLTTITPQIREGSSWTPVERWDLTQTFSDNGDGSKTLWLDHIDHTGLYGGTVTTPPVQLVGIQMPNRVDSPTDMLAPLNRFRLSTIYTDTGAEIQVNYTPTECTPSDHPTEGNSTRRCFPVKWNPFDPEDETTDWFHKYLVAQVIQIDRTGGSADMLTQYDYDGDAGWRKAPADGLTKDDYRTWSVWRGYQKVTVRAGSPQTLTTREEHTFLRGLDGDEKPAGGTRSVSVADSTGASYTDRDELAGQELEVAKYDGARVLTKTIKVPKSWTTLTQTETWGTRRSSMVKTETTRSFTALSPDAQGQARWAETKQIVGYDPVWGRPVQAEDLGDLSTTADDTCTRVGYSDNANSNLYSYRSLVEKFSTSCATTNPDRAATLLESVRTSYDGHAWGAAPTAGVVTREEKLDDVDATGTTYAKTDYEVDSFGRRKKLTDNAGWSTTTEFTDVAGLNVGQKVTNALGHATSATYLPAFGVVTASTDANLKRTDIAYDGLGRVSQVWYPTRPKSLGYSPDVKYSYLVRADKPTVTKTESLRNDGGYRVSYQLFDGLLRDRQRQIEGPGGGWLLSDTIYGPTGDKVVTNGPYLALATAGDLVITVPEGSVNSQKKYLYDGAGRVTDEITAVAGDEKWRTHTTYDGDRTTVDPPAGGIATTTVVDVRGNRTALYQYHGDNPTGAYDLSTYEVDVQGRVRASVGPDGSRYDYKYYRNGRPKSVDDPDTGVTTFTYDKNGNQASKADARGVTVSWVYDKLDRKTEEWLGAPVTGSKQASWTYDSYYKGQLAGTARFTTGGTYYVTYPSRDARYRILKTSYIVPADAGTELARTYDFGMSYNLDGGVQTVGLPAAYDLPAESLAIGYDTQMRPITLTGANTYVTATDYADTGEILRMTMSTGAAGKTAWETLKYERGTGRLLGTRLDRQNVAAVDLDTTYTYDAAGNVLSAADAPAGGDRDVQCFGYDGLRRLDEAWSTANTGTDPCAGGNAAASGVGGPAPYHLAWTFKTSGDRATETAYTAAGAVAASKTYNYTEDAENQPHTLQSVDFTAGGTATHQDFDYDAAGNTTVDGPQSIVWNATGHVQSITAGSQTTSYVYDADGNRLVRKEPGATTLYLGAMQLRLDTSTHQVKGTRHYEFGGRVVASRTASGVVFQVADARGTSLCIVDAASGTLTRRRTTPYGTVRGAVPATWADQRGFIGATVDAGVGLTHIGAREYDPILGRFISADPEFDSDSPQTWNGYAYAGNNPVSLADPSGRRIPDEDRMEESRAAASPGRPWFTLEHNTAVAAAYVLIQAEVIRRGGDPTKVYLGFHIPAGSYKNKGSGNAGFVDIMYVEGDTIFVWEVKAVGQGDELAQDTIDHYAEKLVAMDRFTNKVVEPGFRLPPSAFMVGYPPGSPPGSYIVAFQGPSDGTILYQRFSSWQQQPQPQPTRVPVPVPGPQPIPGRVPVTVPTTAPTPGLPQPSPNPWGPYGFPLPACNAGWVCYLSPETVFGGLLLVGVAVGVAILIAPEVAAGAAAVAGTVTLGGIAYGFAGAV